MPITGHNTQKILDKIYKSFFNICFLVLLQDEEYSSLIESLINAEFNVAFFDTRETGALFILLVLSIENVFGINNTHLNSYQFKYAGKKFPENVPGRKYRVTKK